MNNLRGVDGQKKGVGDRKLRFEPGSAISSGVREPFEPDGIASATRC